MVVMLWWNAQCVAMKCCPTFQDIVSSSCPIPMIDPTLFVAVMQYHSGRISLVAAEFA